MRRWWGWRETYGSEDDDGGFTGDEDKRQVRQVVKRAVLVLVRTSTASLALPCGNG